MSKSGLKRRNRSRASALSFLSHPCGFLLGAALLVVTACQSAAPAAQPTSGSRPGSAATSAATSASATSEQWEQLLAAGRKEGKVVVGGGPFAGLRDAFSEQFTKDTGIQIEFLGLSAGELVSRVDRETAAGKPSMDVVLGGGGAVLTSLPKGLLDPVRPILAQPEVIDSQAWKKPNGIKWLDKDGQYLPQGTEQVTIDLPINTQLVPLGSIKSWKNLLDPKWKGKIIADAPRRSGAGQATGRYLLAKFGDKFFTDLYKGQAVVLARDFRQVAEDVASGKYPIGLATAVASMEEFRKAGLPLAREFPADAPGSVTGGSSVPWRLKNAANPNAGAVFINWLLSRNGQQVITKVLGEPSLRKDVPTTDLPDYIVPKAGVPYEDQYGADFLANQAPSLNQTIIELLGQ